MKKMLVAIGLLGAVAITSCKDDFKVDAPYKNITFAYAIFNMDDTAHYVRIQKAFLDESKSAITMAQNPDSSFYQNLDVFVREIDASGNIRRSFTLSKVDLNLEGYQKDTAGSQGFFSSPNYAYKLKFPVGVTFDPFYQYRVVINNPQTGERDSSDAIGVVNSRSEKDGNNFYISAFNNALLTVGFSVTEHLATFSINGTTPKNGKMLEGIVRFHIVEKNTATNTTKDIFLDYDFDSQIFDPGKYFTLSTYTSNFYSFLKNSLGTAPANTLRYLDSCDLTVYCGSNELYNYQQVNIAQTGGLLGDQVKPIYSNLRGANVYGLVASRAIRTYKNAYIDNATIDSLRANPITRDMGIQARK